MKRNLFALSLVFLLAFPTLGASAVPPAAELLIAGRVDEAVGYLRGRVQAQPDDAEAYALLMRAHYTLEHWDDAIAAGLKAVSLAPANSDYHLWLGRSYGEKASHSSWFTALPLARKCHAEFERAVALNSAGADARSDLAEYYIEAPSFLGGGKDKAFEQAKALEDLGYPGNAYWIRAAIAESQKNYALAEQALRTGVQLSHGSPDTLISLAAFYSRRQRWSEMEAAINQAAGSAIRTEHSGALLDGAEMLYRNGRNWDAAVAMLRNYIAAPVHSEGAPIFQAHYLLGQILEKTGNKQAAVTEYRAALALASDYAPATAALKNLQQ